MPKLPASPLPLVRLTIASAMVLGVGCKSTEKTASVRSYNWSDMEKSMKNGSTETPPHSMSRFEYPFDSKGNYISSWAANGEKQHGRVAYASSGTSSSSTSSYKPSSYTKPKAKPKTSTPASTYTPKPKPAPKPTYRYHTVAAGDTLYSLSRRYGTTVAKIKSINGLSSDLIVNGRSLKMP